MKRNMNSNGEMGGVVALVIGIFLCGGMGLVAGLKTCGKMVLNLLKAGRRFITSYLTGSDANRSTLAKSLVSTLKSSAIALAIVVVTAVCANILYGATLRSLFSFVPKCLLDAIGFLTMGIAGRAVVGVCEKLNMRIDVTQKARKVIEFGMSALMPVAVFKFCSNFTTEGIYLMIATGLASWAYREINKYRAGKAAKAAAAAATN